MTALDYDFTAYSPGSRRLVNFAVTEETGLLLAEATRTARAFPAEAAARVAKGQLTPAEAARGAAVLQAIAADLAAERDFLAELAACGYDPRAVTLLPATLAALAAANGVAWADKVAALRAEIAARRHNYPPLVAKGQLTAPDAKAQLERLEAVHENYWRWAFAFDGTRAALAVHGDAVLDRIVAEAA